MCIQKYASDFISLSIKNILSSKHCIALKYNFIFEAWSLQIVCCHLTTHTHTLMHGHGQYLEEL